MFEYVIQSTQEKTVLTCELTAWHTSDCSDWLSPAWPPPALCHWLHHQWSWSPHHYDLHQTLQTDPPPHWWTGVCSEWKHQVYTKKPKITIKTKKQIKTMLTYNGNKYAEKSFNLYSIFTLFIVEIVLWWIKFISNFV